MIHRLTKGDRVFVAVCYTVLIVTGLLVALPVLNLISVSLSGGNLVYAGAIKLWPEQLQFDAYRYVIQSKTFFSAFRVSVIMTLLGSVLGLLLAVMAAYPLSKPGLPARKWIVLAFVFTMMFSGGIVPQYLLINKLHLLNTIWAVIFPSVTSVFNLLIVKNFFEALPGEIEEAAKIDGASQLKILFTIMLPLSKPVLATIFLFFAVGFWNDYFNARMYITDQHLMPLQVYLRTVIFEAQDPTGNFKLDQNSLRNVAPQSIINATVFLSMLPMAVLYPFLQKHFLRGMVIGSVKG
ncbi:carbohydrate ABC transporter permease [Cohnella zeiphila]|uniref:Carbohydrate ABC transporter permease n=1 Tax=Cohnella zeiphila TaxID=2761120 RepID=A0A7X0STC5_9BACL|nr:carbohydrate ABC transporter permease [Cohnella zeiphila]MBB6734789.1 carbohydrate ABC transporter permease [Cohnella zeiphila]